MLHVLGGKKEALYSGNFTGLETTHFSLHVKVKKKIFDRNTLTFMIPFVHFLPGYEDRKMFSCVIVCQPLSKVK